MAHQLTEIDREFLGELAYQDACAERAYAEQQSAQSFEESLLQRFGNMDDQFHPSHAEMQKLFSIYGTVTPEAQGFIWRSADGTLTEFFATRKQAWRYWRDRRGALTEMLTQGVALFSMLLMVFAPAAQAVEQAVNQPILIAQASQDPYVNGGPTSSTESSGTR